MINYIITRCNSFIADFIHSPQFDSTFCLFKGFKTYEIFSNVMSVKPVGCK